MKKTFFQLIDGSNAFDKIAVPKLQRDYAQGRQYGKNHDKIEQIRMTLLTDMLNALKSTNDPLDLNFVYGAVSGNIFMPIDGQQRLTTLYLLHWYIFAAAYTESKAVNNTAAMQEYEGKIGLLRKFSYETRDTSERFCRKICDTKVVDKLDFSSSAGKSLSEQLKDLPWLSIIFTQDPTVASMLVVIDSMHEVFQKENCVDFAGKLCAANCPITFEYLDLPIYGKANDLYIKMNSRGKMLTDFEIFKAKLQNASWINSLTGSGSVEDYIGRYNLEFAEFFHQRTIANKGADDMKDFDQALMALVKEFVRDEYLSYVRLCGVGQKDYRAEFNDFEKMNGSALFTFIDQGGNKSNNPKYQKSLMYTFDAAGAAKAMIGGLEKAYNLLTVFSDTQNFARFCALNKAYYDEEILFDKILFEPSLEESVVRYSLFSYILKYGIPADKMQEDAYLMWKRFLYNLVSNNRFEGRREDVTEAKVFFHYILEKMPRNPSVDALIACFADESNWRITTTDASGKKKITNLCPAGLMHQIDEEILKAKLIQKSVCWNHVSWRDRIFEMEEYFADSRQIGFILDYAWVGNAGSNRYDRFQYDLSRFEAYCRYVKLLLTADKQLQPLTTASKTAGKADKADKVLFERALLCMDGNRLDPNGDGHLSLQPNAAKSYGFLCGNCRDLLGSPKEKETAANKKKIFNELMSILISRMTADPNSDVYTVLDDIVNHVSFRDWAPNSEWKKEFLTNDWFNMEYKAEDPFFTFRDCVNLDFENGNKDILLLSATNSRSFNMEINTYRLYRRIKELNIWGYDTSMVRLCTYATVSLYPETGKTRFPYRHIELQSMQIGYKDGGFICKENGIVTKISETDALARIKYNLIVQSWMG